MTAGRNSAIIICIDKDKEKDINKETFLEKKRLYREKNKDMFNASTLKWEENNYSSTMLNSAKKRARKHNIEFNISKEDINIPEYCPYLGIKLIHKRGVGRTWCAPSLDRIDPTKGYTKDNIQVISDLANSMKQRATIEQLIVFAKNILKLHGT